MIATFDSLGLDPRLVAALGALGYEEPTPIQAQTIPLLLQGRDVLAQAADDKDLVVRNAVNRALRESAA